MSRVVELVIRLAFVAGAVGGAVWLIGFISSLNVLGLSEAYAGIYEKRQLRMISLALESGYDLHENLEVRRRWEIAPEVFEREVQGWIENNFSLHGFRNRDYVDELNRNRDYWGNTYCCRVFQANSGLHIGFYSVGEDGKSTSRGEDTDDIASWWDNEFYLRRNDRTRLLRLSPALVVVAALAVRGIRWAFDVQS